MMSRLDEQPEGSKNFCDAKLDYMKNVGDGERVDRRRTAAKKSYKNYKSIYNHIKKKLNEIEGSHDKYDELVQYYNAVINTLESLSSNWIHMPRLLSTLKFLMTEVLKCLLLI